MTMKEWIVKQVEEVLSTLALGSEMKAFLFWETYDA